LDNEPQVALCEVASSAVIRTVATGRGRGEGAHKRWNRPRNWPNRQVTVLVLDVERKAVDFGRVDQQHRRLWDAFEAVVHG